MYLSSYYDTDEIEDDLNFKFDNDFRDIEELLKSDSYEYDEQEGEQEGENKERYNSERNKDDIKEDKEEVSKNRDKNKYKLVTRRIDNNRIRHKTAKNVDVKMSLLKSVTMETDSPIRSGAIIFTQCAGNTYFCLGIDRCYGDLTDLSGGIRKNEGVIEGGLRELKEESLGVFDISMQEVQNSLGFHTNNMLIMFLKMNVNMEAIKKEFNEKMKHKKYENLEVTGLIWLDTKEFINCIEGKGRKLYSRVKKILCNVTEIISAL